MGGLRDMPEGFLPNDVTKKIICLGKKKSQSNFPNRAKVTFHFQTCLPQDSDKIIDDSRNMKKPMELIIGQQFKLEIWEVLLKTMGINEIAEFQVPKKYVVWYPILSKTLRDAELSNTRTPHICCGMMAQSCGYHDLDHLLADSADLKFIFEILNIEPPGEYSQESWQLTAEEKLASIPVLKASGNEKFNSGDSFGAKADYFQALSIVEQLSLLEKPKTPEFQAFEEMKIPLLLNFGFCLMKEGIYYEAIQHLTTVVELDSGNAKAHFRRGKCHQEVGNFQEALEDYNTAAQLHPPLSKSVDEEIKSLVLAKKKKDSEDRHVYHKLFA